MLTPQQHDAYRILGYTRLPGALSAGELSVLEKEWQRLWREMPSEHPGVSQRGHAKAGMVADRIEDAARLSPELHAICTGSSLAEAAAAALGSRPILFKDKLITKAPGTHGYGLHQDWPYWSAFGAPADHMVTILAALDGCDEANGALEVWPAASGVLPAPADDPLDVDPAAVDMRLGQIISMAAGDLLLFHPLVPHRSAANKSAGSRRSWFVSYVSEEFAEAARRRQNLNGDGR